MKKAAAAANPDAYVASLKGWQRQCVESLRATARRLARQAAALNKSLGNPQDAAR